MSFKPDGRGYVLKPLADALHAQRLHAHGIAIRLEVPGDSMHADRRDDFRRVYEFLAEFSGHTPTLFALMHE